MLIDRASIFSNVPVSKALICKPKPFSICPSENVFFLSNPFNSLLPLIFFTLTEAGGFFGTHYMHQVSLMALTEMPDQYPWKFSSVWLERRSSASSGWIITASADAKLDAGWPVSDSETQEGVRGTRLNRRISCRCNSLCNKEHSRALWRQEVAGTVDQPNKEAAAACIQILL